MRFLELALVVHAVDVRFRRGRHDEAGEEVHHHDAVFFVQPLEHVIRHISLLSATACAEECEKITGAVGHIERIVHRLGRHVRDIDHHSQARSFSSRLALPNGESPLLFGASVAESAQLNESVCVSVMYRAPRL